MRIISGNYRGRKLDTIEGDDTRPTTDRVKESIFNLIQFDIAGAVVLDLFAGSGALGIEALSRGAKFVALNDYNKKAISVIQKNINGIKGNYEVKNLPYREFLDRNTNTFSLIFLDPPYKMEIENELLTYFLSGTLDSGGIVVYESDRPLNDVNGYEKIKEKKYGITYVTVFRRIL